MKINKSLIKCDEAHNSPLKFNDIDKFKNSRSNLYNPLKSNATFFYFSKFHFSKAPFFNLENGTLRKNWEDKLWEEKG